MAFLLLLLLSSIVKHIKSVCSTTVGLKQTGEKCLRPKQRGTCRGILTDTILDWEDALPDPDMRVSELVCKHADLCLCLGTSLQIMPVGNYPLLTKKNPSGRVVVINLQKTRIDKHADLVINCKLDVLFQLLFQEFLSIELTVPRPVEILLKLAQDDDVNDKFLLDVSNVSIDEAFN